jgi:hypothetical protein
VVSTGTPSAPSVADNANIIQITPATVVHDDWIIEPVVAGQYQYFHIKNNNSGKVIQIASSSTAEGGAAQQFTKGAGTNQQFEIISTAQ